MNLNKALYLATNEIYNVCENPAKVAKRLLMHHLNASIEWIFLHGNENLNNEIAYFELVRRFKNYEPLDYILGFTSFYGLDFDVESGVLIPRPETEILVDKSLEILSSIKKPRVAEIGVGSGVISICLALKLGIFITATDINKKALNLTFKNAKKFGVSKYIKLIQTSYLEGIFGDFDLVVSNPPYIANDYVLDKFVLNEPKNALFGGFVGDEILKDIIKISANRGIRNLACEIGYNQKSSLSKALEQSGYKAEFYQDLAGFDRGFVAKLI